MIGSGLLCLLVGHKTETEWDTEYGPGLGAAEVEKEYCLRCDHRTPTGRDRPLDRQS